MTQHGLSAVGYSRCGRIPSRRSAPLTCRASYRLSPSISMSAQASKGMSTDKFSRTALGLRTSDSGKRYDMGQGWAWRRLTRVEPLGLSVFGRPGYDGCPSRTPACGGGGETGRRPSGQAGRGEKGREKKAMTCQEG